MARADPATQSNYLSIRTTSLHLDWNIDWETRIISGSVEHTFEAQHDDVHEVILDSSYLVISSVESVPARLTSDASSGSSAVRSPLKYTLDKRHPVMGNALHIRLPSPTLKKGERTSVRIAYSTTDKCTALGWLEAEQTASGNHPFLYSQCQAIHMRSLAPCMDTPAVKATYTASVSSYLPVLMSALRVSPPSEQVLDIAQGKQVIYTYSQPVPIPSYLIAVAAGEVAYKRVGKRTGVWADPKTLPAATWEFEEDMEKYLTEAEKILPPYEFGDYDVLVLPPSFPFGGMENANLTFLTPTLLAGDRSLVDVVAHELSHSWSGNNVGCKSWEHFWLNESWTTYLERLLIRSQGGEPARGFSYIIGRKALQDSLDAYEKAGMTRYQRMVVPFEFGEDPDDAFSTVPYDKGGNLLLYLEGVVGGLDAFLPYVRDYFVTFAGKSIGTDEWRSHLFSFFEKAAGGKEIVDKLEKEVDWQAWLHGEGLGLPVQVKYDTTLADKAYALAKRWDQASHDGKDAAKVFAKEDLADFSSSQTVVFLEALEAYNALSSPFLTTMNNLYGFNATENAEIRLRWYNVALKGDGKDFKAAAAKWVVTIGRMKMCRPITKALFKCDPELAVRTYLDAESFYHPIARLQLRKDLKLPPAEQ